VINAFKKALSFDPFVVELHLNVAILYINLNRTEDAITSYKKAVQLKPSLIDAYYNLGTAL
jgi:tetratricopeptide (TPR) repeat protein